MPSNSCRTAVESLSKLGCQNANFKPRANQDTRITRYRPQQSTERMPRPLELPARQAYMRATSSPIAWRNQSNGPISLKHLRMRKGGASTSNLLPPWDTSLLQVHVLDFHA